MCALCVSGVRVQQCVGRATGRLRRHSSLIKSEGGPGLLSPLPAEVVFKNSAARISLSSDSELYALLPGSKGDVASFRFR